MYNLKNTVGNGDVIAGGNGILISTVDSEFKIKSLYNNDLILNIISKSRETGEQSSPPKTVSQSALADISAKADIINHFLIEKADRLSVFGQPQSSGMNTDVHA
ncbi:MAG: hypothetical protein ACTTH7_06850 [Treponema sp.]